MHPLALLLIIGLYFLLLLGIGYAGKKHNNNASFYLGGKQSPWYVVAFGMLGASLSGITFVSVPGMVMHSGYSYMQLVVGFSLGTSIPTAGLPGMGASIRTLEAKAREMSSARLTMERTRTPAAGVSS